MWKGTEDLFLSPQVFLNLQQIQHLCHLAHANAAMTIDNLQNNFKWSWMEDYGSALLDVIHGIYKPKPSSDSRDDDNPDNSNPLSPSSSTHQPGTAPSASSKSMKISKQHMKRGIGTQHCSACQMVGHNSESLFLLGCRYLFNLDVESNSHCPKKSLNNHLGDLALSTLPNDIW